MNTPTAKQIRRARKAAGLTQQRLATKLSDGADLMLVSRWERGQTVPSAHYLDRLREVLPGAFVTRRTAAAYLNSQVASAGDAT